MSGDRTWYTVTAYWPGPAGFQEVDTLLSGRGFQTHSARPGLVAHRGVPGRPGIADRARAAGVAAWYRFAFEVSEEATDFDMGRRYTYLPDQDVLHQTTVGNDRTGYLPIQ
jgi:hypothetical protein